MSVIPPNPLIPFRPALQYLVPPASPAGLSRTRRPVWQSAANSSTNSTAFEPTSKRRKGYLSETHVKRGFRVVRGDRELVEKLGRNDLCPCGSGRRFQALLPRQR
jgi:SEC-C motif